jgi:hypothetical protein
VGGSRKSREREHLRREIAVKSEPKWSPSRRALDLAINQAAEKAALAIRASGSHADAFERLVRLMLLHLDAPQALADHPPSRRRPPHAA